MNELVVSMNSSAIMPVMDIEGAIMRRQAIVDFTSKIMQEDRDYGKIPGTNKATLLKPGAEKLTTFFGLSPYFDIIESATDWTGKDHDGEPFFYFSYRCTLKRGELIVGAGDGSCNSWEKKYRYRKGGITCPNCGKSDTIIKGKAEYGGGWICFAKKGGCGSKWPDGSPAINGQSMGQVKNDSPADLVNTIQKMAQKRALVAATLIAVNASEFFTQDLEDYADVIEAEYSEAPKPKPQPVVVQSPPEPLSDDEQLIYEASAGEWMQQVMELVSRYDNAEAIKNVLKKHGYSGVPLGNGVNTMKRVEMYRVVRDYALLRDAEDSANDDLGLPVESEMTGAYVE